MWRSLRSLCLYGKLHRTYILMEPFLQWIQYGAACRLSFGEFSDSLRLLANWSWMASYIMDLQHGRANEVKLGREPLQVMVWEKLVNWLKTLEDKSPSPNFIHSIFIDPSDINMTPQPQSMCHLYRIRDCPRENTRWKAGIGGHTITLLK